MINKSCSTEYSVQFLKHLCVNKTIAQINTGFNKLMYTVYIVSVLNRLLKIYY